MKKRISYLIVAAITVVSSFMQVYAAVGDYYGVEFYFNYLQIVFCSLSFMSLAILLKNRDNSLFISSNLIRLCRMGSRRKALIIELIDVACIVLIMEIIGDVSVLLSSLILNREIIIKRLLLFFVLKFAVILFIMILQFILELCVSYDFSFIAICILFLLFLMFGSAAFSFVQENPAAEITPILKCLNKFNIVNYISLERAERLVANIGYAVFSIFIFIIIEIIYIVIRIKKLDILSKE